MNISLRYRLEHAVVMTIRVLVQTLPRRISLGFGTAVGRIFYLLHGRRRELATVSYTHLTLPTNREV